MQRRVSAAVVCFLGPAFYELLGSMCRGEVECHCFPLATRSIGRAVEWLSPKGREPSLREDPPNQQEGCHSFGGVGEYSLVFILQVQTEDDGQEVAIAKAIPSGLRTFLGASWYETRTPRCGMPKSEDHFCVIGPTCRFKCSSFQVVYIDLCFARPPQQKMQLASSQ